MIGKVIEGSIGIDKNQRNSIDLMLESELPTN